MDFYYSKSSFIIILSQLTVATESLIVSVFDDERVILNIKVNFSPQPFSSSAPELPPQHTHAHPATPLDISPVFVQNVY